MTNKSIKVLISVLLFLIISFLIIVFSGSRIFTDYLWFESLDFVYTFLVMLFANFSIRIIIGLIFTVFIFINLSFTKKTVLNFIQFQENDQESKERKSMLDEIRNNKIVQQINQKRLTIFYLLGSIILGFLLSGIGQNAWEIVLKYFNQVSFETVDPIFSRDLSFYVFTLPFYNFIRELGMILVVLTLIIVSIIYLVASGSENLNKIAVNLSGFAKKHMTVLVALFLLLKAWGYRLSIYDLLYSTRGVTYGASYTDINANLLGLRILFVVAILAAILVLSSIFKKNYKILGYTLGLWLLTSFIFGVVYPGFMQRFGVEPNELERERPFIAHNIEMTLQAYNLDEITRENFEVENNITESFIEENEDFIKNVRLWDYRPLKTTYSQLQELRQYYTFNDVDIDRYHVDGKYRQVMLSIREMNHNRLPDRAQTWVNRTLQYTHGYGLTMSPVGELTEEGRPEYFFKDIPPTTDTDLSLKNPAIYYGEMTNNYVISNSDAAEFHYPRGEENVYINYDGEGGVELNSYFKRILFALRMNEFKFLLSDDINPESRVMFERQIQNRVRKVAPFLDFDDDPYPVIAEDRIFWIQDAYTTTDRYPYSEPIPGMGNYIRNSIKVVIDAYEGDMDFYIVDEEDPLAMTYKNIFPDLFTSGKEMSAELKAHIRYPVDLFKYQAEIYSTYHMTDPTVFYNKEDMWTFPNEKYADENVIMEPYYVINQLPGEEEAEFILMLPFTPARRNNMISWMAARNDGDRFGELFLYDFPKDENFLGPSQIESDIDQHGEISQILSLWDQRGSNVIRGNLLVLPVENSILYIEPVFLQADTQPLPSLRRVIVHYNDRMVMRPNLREALRAVLQEEEAIVREDIEDVEEELMEEELPVGEEPLSEPEEFGEYIQQLEEILDRLEELSSRSN